jgi:hypothetical protein
MGANYLHLGDPAPQLRRGRRWPSTASRCSSGRCTAEPSWTCCAGGSCARERPRSPWVSLITRCEPDPISASLAVGLLSAPPAVKVLGRQPAPEHLPPECYAPALTAASTMAAGAMKAAAHQAPLQSASWAQAGIAEVSTPTAAHRGLLRRNHQATPNIATAPNMIEPLQLRSPARHRYPTETLSVPAPRRNAPVISHATSGQRRPAPSRQAR